MLFRHSWCVLSTSNELKRLRRDPNSSIGPDKSLGHPSLGWPTGSIVVPPVVSKSRCDCRSDRVGKTPGELESMLQVLLPRLEFPLRCRPHQVSRMPDPVLHGGRHAGATSRRSESRVHHGGCRFGHGRRVGDQVRRLSRGCSGIANGRHRFGRPSMQTARWLI